MRYRPRRIRHYLARTTVQPRRKPRERYPPLARLPGGPCAAQVAPALDGLLVVLAKLSGQVQ